MGATQRFRHDPVDDPEPQQLRRGQAQRLGGFLRVSAVAPQDRGAALGRDYRIDGVLQHQDGIGGGERDRAARATLADHARHHRDTDIEAGFDRPRDRLALAARLGIDTGIGARGIDKGQDRQSEPFRQPHQSARLAVAFWPRHAEIVFDPGLGVSALFGAEDQHAAAAKPADAADDCRVLGKGPVAGKRHEIGDQRGNIRQ